MTAGYSVTADAPNEPQRRASEIAPAASTSTGDAMSTSMSNLNAISSRYGRIMRSNASGGSECHFF